MSTLLLVLFYEQVVSFKADVPKQRAFDLGRVGWSEDSHWLLFSSHAMIRSFQERKNTSINLYCIEETTELQESREVVFRANAKQDSHESGFPLRDCPYWKQF